MLNTDIFQKCTDIFENRTDISKFRTDISEKYTDKSVTDATNENLLQNTHCRRYKYILVSRPTRISSEDSINTDRYGVAFSSNAIIGIITEWYRQDFKASVQEMNEKLVEIIKRKMPV